MIETDAAQLGLGDIALRLGLALVIAGLLGFEREIKERPAGLRTFALVGLATSLLTIVAQQLALDFAGIENIRSDPVRVIEAVTAGVAFLAAGTIIVTKSDVKGLTTAAGLWLAAAIGVGCGAGQFAAVSIAAILAIVAILALRLIESRLPKKD